MNFHCDFGLGNWQSKKSGHIICCLPCSCIKCIALCHNKLYYIWWSPTWTNISFHWPMFWTQFCRNVGSLKFILKTFWPPLNEHKWESGSIGIHGTGRTHPSILGSLIVRVLICVNLNHFHAHFRCRVFQLIRESYQHIIRLLCVPTLG